MAIVNGYTDRNTMKSRLSLEPSDSEFDLFIDATVNSVSRWVDKRSKRFFYQIAEARVFEAQDRYNLLFGTYSDLVSVTELATDEDGDGTFEATWDAAEYQLRPVNANAAPEPRPFRRVRAVDRRFPIASTRGARVERVRLDGTWGWPAIPDDITMGTLIQCSRIFKRREAPEGIIGLNQFGVVRVAGKPDPDVVDLLNPYRLRVVG